MQSNIKLKIAYCIRHGKEVVIDDSLAIPFHYQFSPYLPFGEYEKCVGLLVSCPPPEMTEEQWQSILDSEEV